MNLNYRHWKPDSDQEGIVWCRFDKAESGTNVLSSEVLAEFNSLLGRLVDQQARGLVILSAKPNGFIAGADVSEFTAVQTPEQARTLIDLGQTAFNTLAALPIPSVSLINGFCLGGGLELALACRYRVALDDARTRLGLPEVLLGIHPGWGGNLRLTRLIGAAAALELILSGRTVDARTALRLGLVDRIAPERHCVDVARDMIMAAPGPHTPGILKTLASHALIRPAVAGYLRRRLNQRVRREHYPAPHAVLDLWQRHWGDPGEMLRAEAESIVGLVTTPAARNLIKAFLLQERLKDFGKNSAFKPAHVHVVGAGVMGGDIAAWCALNGLRVTLQDRAPRYIAPALGRARELFRRRLREPRLVQAALDRLQPDVPGAGVGRADVVVEAIIENIDAKRSLYQALEPRLKPGALLATNTSSIALGELSQSLQQPARLIGVHFFNPVAKMRLVEIVHAEHTAPAALDAAAAFCRAIDRLPLPVKDAPGFLINRILMPYLMEAMLLLEEGCAAEAVDKAARDFGMPVGPIELADTVGLDICLSVAGILAASLPVSVPDQLRRMVDAGHLGRKSGRGFYAYRQGRPRLRNQGPAPVPDSCITERLMLRLLNEAMACLREGVVADADLLDAGMIFATGFAPFRGGPMGYVETRGRQDLRQQLEEFSRKYGGRFAPDPGWS